MLQMTSNRVTKSTCLALALAAASVVLAAPAGAGEDDQRPCMTKLESKHVVHGMPMAQAFRIIDSAGRRVRAGGDQRARAFNLCWTQENDITIFYSYRNGAWRVLGQVIWFE